MSEDGESSSAAAYQLRVVLRRISSLIWRRLLIPDITIADLHAVLQIAFGWTGVHLHRSWCTVASTASVTSVASASMTIRGKFGWLIWSAAHGAIHLPRRLHRRVCAATCGWSRSCPLRRANTVRRVRGGRRAGPPVDCGGVGAFLERTQPHHVLAATLRAAEILDLLLDDFAPLAEHRDEPAGLLPLLGRERFDRRQVNRALATLTVETDHHQLPANLSSDFVANLDADPDVARDEARAIAYPATAPDPVPRELTVPRFSPRSPTRSTPSPPPCRDRPERGMKITAQVVLHADDDSETAVRGGAALHRDTVAPDNLGVRLTEAQDLLCAVQDTMVTHQVVAGLAAQVA